MTAALPLIPVVDARLGGALPTAGRPQCRCPICWLPRASFIRAAGRGDGPGVLCRRHHRDRARTVSGRDQSAAGALIRRDPAGRLVERARAGVALAGAAAGASAAPSVRSVRHLRGCKGTGTRSRCRVITRLRRVPARLPLGTRPKGREIGHWVKHHPTQSATSSGLVDSKLRLHGAFSPNDGGSGPGAPSDLPDAGATLIAILLLLLGLWVAIWPAIASLALL
jgi:hypothetical protein